MITARHRRRQVHQSLERVVSTAIADANVIVRSSRSPSAGYRQAIGAPA
jgi:hypothetical protein